MTGILVSLGLLALLILLVAPGIALLVRPRAAAPAALFYAALFVALGGYHVGLPRQAHADLLRPPQTLVGTEGNATELCAQVLTQSRQAGIIIDRPNPRQVRVNRDYWAELPEQVKEAIGLCLRAPARPGAPPNDIEIVEVAGR